MAPFQFHNRLDIDGTGEKRTTPMRFNRELPLKSKICVVNLMHILSTKKTHESQTIQIYPKWRLFRMKHSLKWTWGMLICILKSK